MRWAVEWTVGCWWLDVLVVGANEFTHTTLFITGAKIAKLNQSGTKNEWLRKLGTKKQTPLSWTSAGNYNCAADEPVPFHENCEAEPVWYKKRMAPRSRLKKQTPLKLKQWWYKKERCGSAIGTLSTQQMSQRQLIRSWSSVYRS